MRWRREQEIGVEFTAVTRPILLQSAELRATVARMRDHAAGSRPMRPPFA